jgi:hypothetical protein
MYSTVGCVWVGAKYVILVQSLTVRAFKFPVVGFFATKADVLSKTISTDRVLDSTSAFLVIVFADLLGQRHFGFRWRGFDRRH